jgi:uncharacterized protein YbaP (TraB family)
MSPKSALLWKATKANLTHNIFGTIHLQYDCISWPKAAVLALITQTDYYYGEMNLDDAKGLSYSSYLLPENQTIQNNISERKYFKLKKILWKAFSVDMDTYNSMYPLFLQYRIDTSIAGESNSPSIDEYLWKHALDSNCKVDGLESKIDQLNILHQLPVEFQIKSIRDIGNNVSAYRRNIQKMISVYEAANINGLKKKAIKSMGKYKGLMIYARNEKMTHKIDQLAHPSFIAVGAGHLAGQYGILAKLKRKGWKLSPI